MIPGVWEWIFFLHRNKFKYFIQELKQPRSSTSYIRMWKKMKTFQNKIYTLLTCPKLSRYFYFETAEIFILSYMEIVNQLSLVTPWPLVVYCIAESFEQNTRSLIKEYISCKYIQKVKIFFKNWKTNLTAAQCSSCFNQT